MYQAIRSPIYRGVTVRARPAAHASGPDERSPDDKAIREYLTAALTQLTTTARAGARRRSARRPPEGRR